MSALASHHFESLLDASERALLIVSSQHRIDAANAAAACLLQRDTAELIGMRVTELLPGMPLGEGLEREDGHELELRDKRLQLKVTALHRKVEADQAWLCELGEVHTNPPAVVNLDAQLAIVAAHSSDLIAIIDVSGRRLYNSASYRGLLSAAALAPGGDSFAQIHPDDKAQVIRVFQDTVQSGIGRSARFRMLADDGTVRTIESQSGVTFGTDGRVASVVVVSRDISAMHADKVVREARSTDQLTLLPLRGAMHQALSECLRSVGREQSLAVLVIDIDNFTQINHSFGLSVGDMLLHQAAQRLRQCLRESDLIGRQSGDEFMLILPQVRDRAGVGAVAEKLLTALTPSFMIDGHELQISASIGISLYRDDAADAESLIRHASAALAHAKAGGNNSYQFFSAAIQLQTQQRLAIQSGLRTALSEQQLTLYYQPCVDARQQRIMAAEALVRWNHPDLGLLNPPAFIPQIESSALICALGDWVLTQACKQNKAWQDAGFTPIRVAVNVSARQLQEHDFAERVRYVLKVSNLDARWLELEITESVLLQNVEGTISTLKQLREMGVQVAIDDFGTGYSSLSYLKKFGVDRLKIDREFVRDITEDASDAAIVAAIIAVADALGLHTTAEGVETSAQHERLQQLGCRELQGFLLGMPQPPEEFTTLLSTSELGLKVPQAS